jgi:hypothetical protein
MFSVQYDVEKPNKNVPAQEQSLTSNNENTVSNTNEQNENNPINKQQ